MRIATVLVVFVALLGAACDKAATDTNSSTLPRESFTTGDNGYIVTPGDKNTWIAPTEDDFDRMNQLITAKDQMGVEQMYRAGKLLVVDNGTPAKVISAGLFKHEVRVLAGPHAGRSAFVAVEFMTKKNPNAKPTSATAR